MRKKLLFIINVDWFLISHRIDIILEALNRGYDTHVACGITDKKEFLENLGIKLHPINISRKSINIKNEIKTAVDILKVLKQVNPDIVHFVTIKPVIYGGLISKFFCREKIKRVFAISGLGYIFFSNSLKARIIRKLIKAMYKIALNKENSYVIVQNEQDKLFISSMTNIPVVLIKGSGVNLEEFNCTRDKEENKNIKVVMASRLLKNKGVFEYIEAAKILKRKYPFVEFELYGSIDEGNPLSLSKDDIHRIKNENIVNFKGFAKDIKKVFSKASIVVLPSYYGEGLPKVLIEAAACGKAIVTTDHPGCRDAIIPNVTGLLCKPKDPISLAKAIEKLICDFELRTKMGEKARKLAEKEYDIKKVIEKHFEIYENGVNG